MLEETREKREIVSSGPRISRKLLRGEMGREKKTQYFTPRRRRKRVERRRKWGGKRRQKMRFFPTRRRKLASSLVLISFPTKKSKQKRNLIRLLLKVFHRPFFYGTLQT